MSPRFGAMVVMAALLLGSLLQAPPAGARTPTVAVDIERSEVRIDLSTGSVDAAAFTGTVSVGSNELQTAQVSLELAPGPLNARIDPANKEMLGSGSFDFTVTVLAAGAPEGSHLLKVFARAEAPPSDPASAVDTVTVRVVRNRVRIECSSPVKEGRPDQTVGFSLKACNDGSTGDTFTTSAEGRGGRLDRMKWLLDQTSVDVAPGDFVYCNVEVSLAPNAPAGNYTVAFRAFSSASSNSSAEVILTVVVPARPAVPSGPAGPNYLLVAAVCLAALGICLTVFIGGTEVGLLAFLQFIFVPLFVRIKKERVLDHFTRGQIYGYIRANPGTHYIAVQEHLDLENGVLAYHLRVLEREEYITSERDGVYKRFYPKHVKVPEKERQLSRVQKDIVSALAAHPGTSQNGLARLLGESKQVIGYHVRVLSSAGLVRVEREGNQTRCFLTREAGERPAEATRKPDEAEEALPDILPELRA